MEAIITKPVKNTHKLDANLVAETEKILFSDQSKFSIIIERIFNDQDVDLEYNQLASPEQLALCSLVCAKLANDLDNLSEVDNEFRIVNTGKFLNKVSSQIFLVAVGNQMGIERLVKYNLDQKTHWSEACQKATKAFDLLQETSES